MHTTIRSSRVLEQAGRRGQLTWSLGFFATVLLGGAGSTQRGGGGRESLARCLCPVLESSAGNGTFATHVIYPTHSGPGALASGDLDGDGDLDLALVTPFADCVAVLMNHGMARSRSPCRTARA
jgi:hypothetical protein